MNNYVSEKLINAALGRSILPAALPVVIFSKNDTQLYSSVHLPSSRDKDQTHRAVFQ